MKKHYDVVIIGSGLGGLVSAVILASEGYSVCVLEKNNQYGGNLQTFVRDKSIFDTGVHYIGGLSKGENLYQYFNYLGIMQDLKLKKLDVAFDRISFDDDDKEYAHYQGYDVFKEKLLEDFPKEEEAIDKYLEKITEICHNFPLYNVDLGSGYIDRMDSLSLNTKDFLDSITDDERLKTVLVGTNLLYAGDERTPFFVHALSVNAYLYSAYKCVNGGSQIAKLLLRKIKKYGGEFYKYQKVTEIKTEDKKVQAVKTEKGDVISADIVISNIEPKHTLDMITGSTIRKSYVNRIKNLESVISAFSVYIVLKPETFKYFNYNVYHFKNHKDAFTAQNYTQENWPLNYMIALNSKTKSSEWADNMTVMMYMKYDDVKQWEHTFNTKVEENERGEDYETFKAQKAEIVLKELEKKYPNIRECIQSIHSSTPLSYRDYIGGNRGCMYGYTKDSAQPLKSFLSSKTKIKGLYFTGQSVKMHGILGVTINAVTTCGEILGAEYLIKKINEANT